MAPSLARKPRARLDVPPNHPTRRSATKVPGQRWKVRIERRAQPHG
jgi:hypothetical protein